MDKKSNGHDLLKSKTTDFVLRRADSQDGEFLDLPVAVTPDQVNNRHKPIGVLRGMQSGDQSPANHSDLMSSPVFANTPVMTSGAHLEIKNGGRPLITPQPTNTHFKVPTSTNSVAGDSFNPLSVYSPVECMPETSVYVYVEDLIIPVNPDTAITSFDESLNLRHYQMLKAEYNPVFVTSMADLEPHFTATLQEHWAGSFEGKVIVKSIKDLMEEVRRGGLRVVMSDELLFKQSVSHRSELLASGCIMVFASLFTRNESWQGINYNKVPTGRGASNILWKLKYSHLKERILIGLFIESKYFKPKMTHLFEDCESVCFVPALFNEVPNVEFDYLFQRVNQYKSKMLMNNDLGAKKIFDNYMQYEDKCQNCVFIDRYDCAKVMMYRSEFMELLKEHCEIENNRLEGNYFHIPWTRSGDYLDCLNNINADTMISKLCSSIPYPLITKSDLACGDKSTHSFMIIKEQPEDWPDLKEKIFKQYHGKPFILQSYFTGERNIVIKSMYFLGEFTFQLNKGLNDKADNPDIHTGEFIDPHKKSFSSERTQSIDVPGTPGEPNDKPLEISMPPSPMPRKASIDADTIKMIKDFTISLAHKMRLNMVGIDFLVDTSSDPKRIVPIDLNKMPRPDNIPNFREQLLNLCLRPSSKVEFGHRD